MLQNALLLMDVLILVYLFTVSSQRDELTGYVRTSLYLETEKKESNIIMY